MMDRAFLEVNLSALRHNLEQIQKFSGQSKIMAVVKDQCYGLGLETVLFLQDEGIDFFAVASLSEAIELRDVGIDQEILIFGYTSPERFGDIIKYDLIQTAFSLEYLLKLDAYNENIRVHIKVDTGMNRTGIQCDVDILKQVYQLKQVSIEGIYSHLLSADQPKDGHQKAVEQIEMFKQLLDELQALEIEVGLTHMHNSAGIYYFGQTYQFDYVRPGLLLASDAEMKEFQKIISLKARVAMVKDVAKGEQIGYGIENVLSKDTRVATIAIGYGDGLQRRLATFGYKVKIKHQLCPVLGRICMDQMMVDASGLDVHEGDIATLLDREFSIYEMARMLDSNENQILVQILPRVERVLINGDEKVQ